VAHQLSDDPIDRWLGHSPSRELWWIASEPPDDIHKVQSWTNELNRIVGPLGEPQRFFSQLSLRLLTPHELWEPSSASETPPSFGVETLLKDTKELSGDVSAIQSLQTEIQKTQSVLYQLDREFGTTRTPQIQAQVDYQKLRVNRLEDQARVLEPAKQSILKLAGRIAEEIRLNAPSAIPDATAATGIINFAQSQFDTLQEEFQKGTPNQYIVSGSLGATLSVADRLLAEYGTKVVSAEVVKALAAYAPSGASKLVF